MDEIFMGIGLVNHLIPVKYIEESFAQPTSIMWWFKKEISFRWTLTATMMETGGLAGWTTLRTSWQTNIAGLSVYKHDLSDSNFICITFFA